MMRDIFLKILNNISSLRDLDVYDILYSINILSLKGLSFCVTLVNNLYFCKKNEIWKQY